MEKLHFTAGILPRVQKDGLLKALYFTIARFQLVRWAGNFLLGLRRIKRDSVTKLANRRPAANSMFQGVNPDIVVSAVRSNSWFPNFDLSKDKVNDIALAASDSLLSSPTDPEYKFREEDREHAERHLGHPLTFAEYSDLADSNSTIAAICDDPIVLSIAQKYLGRKPQNIRPRLFMSFVANAGSIERLQQKQTIYFHYDSDAFRVISFNFYLTDTDENSGAHVLVEGTHGGKRLRHLFGTTNVAEDDVAESYPDGKTVVIAGERGYGFVEDCYCLHKALVPKTHNRLFLQIRCF